MDALPHSWKIITIYHFALNNGKTTQDDDYQKGVLF